MKTGPEPTNPVLDVVDTIITQLIYTVGVESAVTAAVIKFPVLGYPLIGTIFKTIVTSIANKVFFALKPYVNMNIIKFQNAAQRASYDKAIADLRKASTTGNAEDIKNATDKAKSTLDDLINFNH